MRFSISAFAVFVTSFGFGLSQRLTAEFQSIGIVHDAVEDGVCEGGFADDVMPGRKWSLAGDEDGPRTVPVFDDFHQITALVGGEAVGATVVKDQKLRFGEASKQTRETAVAMRQFQLVEEPWQASVEHGRAISAGGLDKCAGKPGIADTTGAGGNQIAFVSDPFGGQNILEQHFVEAAPSAVVDIFVAGANAA